MAELRQIIARKSECGSNIAPHTAHESPNWDSKDFNSRERLHVATGNPLTNASGRTTRRQCLISPSIQVLGKNADKSTRTA
jgi:hypothetical protein